MNELTRDDLTALNQRERERETSLRSHTPILTAPSLPSQLPPPLPSS